MPRYENSLSVQTDEWIKNMWHTYLKEYDSALRRKEFLSFATRWIDFEGIMLSETSLKRKTSIR